MINLIIILITGGIVGWLASLIMGTDASQGVLANIVIGIVGALLSGWLFGTVLGFGGAYSAGDFSFLGILWGVLGAVVLIGVLKLFRVMR